MLQTPNLVEIETTVNVHVGSTACSRLIRINRGVHAAVAPINYAVACTQDMHCHSSSLTGILCNAFTFHSWITFTFHSGIIGNHQFWCYILDTQLHYGYNTDHGDFAQPLSLPTI